MTHNNLIDNQLRHFSKINSENSFSYLIDYYLRKGLSNYIDVISDIIIQSKNPVNLFNHALRRFYTEAVFKKDFLPYKLLVNSKKITNHMDKDFIKELYKNALLFLRNGKNLNEVETKLFTILSESILIEISES